MPEDDGTLLLQLARGLEQLLQAAAEAARRARERVELSRGPRAGAAVLLAQLLESAEGEGLERLRAALRRELGRWSERARDDRAAARVRDLFAALLDVLEPDESGRGERPAPARSAPRTRRAVRRRSP